MTLELVEGTMAWYRVKERLVGVDFGNEAVGTTEATNSEIVLKATVPSTPPSRRPPSTCSRSRATRHCATSIWGALLQTQEFPMLEFVPSRTERLPNPLLVGTPYEVNPAITIPGALGFDLIGNVTMHGVTSEITCKSRRNASPQHRSWACHGIGDLRHLRPHEAGDPASGERGGSDQS